MKMLKKLLAVALAGVMAVSMLAGCSTSNQRRYATALKNALNSAAKLNTHQSVVNYIYDSRLDSLASRAYVHVTQENKWDLAKAAGQITGQNSANHMLSYESSFAYTVVDLKVSDSKDLKDAQKPDVTLLDSVLQHSLKTAQNYTVDKTAPVKEQYFGQIRYYSSKTEYIDYVVKGSDMNAGTSANPAQVRFGVQFYPGKDGNGKDTYYAVVVVELIKESDVPNAQP